jgi:hypothetical protein
MAHSDTLARHPTGKPAVAFKEFSKSKAEKNKHYKKDETVRVLCPSFLVPVQSSQ